MRVAIGQAGLVAELDTPSGELCGNDSLSRGGLTSATTPSNDELGNGLPVARQRHLAPIICLLDIGVERRISELIDCLLYRHTRHGAGCLVQALGNLYLLTAFGNEVFDMLICDSLSVLLP